jgi:hypothetical protein
MMSSLVEAIGGTTRIIFSYKDGIGHAYAEVYLGRLCSEDDRGMLSIINWLEQKYNVDRIYTHIDSETKDVWLSLDWGEDEKGYFHPGGPYFPGDKNIFIYILNNHNVPLTPPPIRINSITPKNPEAGKDVIFYGSEDGEWWSNLDGFLCKSVDGSCQAQMKTPGTHEITLKVVYNNRIRSEAKTFIVVSTPR